MSSVPAPRRALALIIVRESNETLAAGWSPDEYVARCRVRAAELGVAVLEPPLIEVGKRNEWDSPKLLHALELAKSGAYGYLIAPDTARLAGDLGKLLWIKRELETAGVEIAYANQQFAKTAEGDLHEIIIGAFDQYERTKIAMRFAGGRAGKLTARVPIGSGKAPYGSTKTHDDRGRVAGYAPAEHEVDVLKRIVRDVQTRTLGAVAAGLNAEGVPTPSGRGRWQASTVYKLIVNPHYAGEYQWGRRKQEPKRRADGTRWWQSVRNDPSNVTAIPIDALVDPGELAAARDALTSRRTKRRARIADEDDPFTLRGALFCGACGGALSTAGRGPRRYYLCLRAYARGSDRSREERCPLPHVPAEAIEAYAWAGLRGLLEATDEFEAELRRAADGGEATRRHEARVAAISGKIMKLRARIANGARQLRDFDPDGDTYATLLAGQQADEREVKALDASLAELERDRPVTLSAEGADAAREHRRLLLAGLEAAERDPSAQRALYGLLGVRGRVSVDGAGGVPLGARHRFAVDWLDPDGSMDGVPHSWKSGTPYILTPAAQRVRPSA